MSGLYTYREPLDVLRRHLRLKVRLRICVLGTSVCRYQVSLNSLFSCDYALMRQERAAVKRSPAIHLLPPFFFQRQNLVNARTQSYVNQKSSSFGRNTTCITNCRNLLPANDLSYMMAPLMPMAISIVAMH